LDDGLKRNDAVKDIGALLDWIETQPGLDADRVMVKGASYGGYLSLSVACTYSEQIRGTVSDSGISNLANFVSAPKAGDDNFNVQSLAMREIQRLGRSWSGRPL